MTFQNPTGVGGNAPVGDLFQSVLINFGADGPRTDWSFQQDTDNDIRITQVPEPGSLAIAALGLGLVRRRRR